MTPDVAMFAWLDRLLDVGQAQQSAVWDIASRTPPEDKFCSIHRGDGYVHEYGDGSGCGKGPGLSPANETSGLFSRGGGWGDGHEHTAGTGPGDGCATGDTGFEDGDGELQRGLWLIGLSLPGMPSKQS